VSIADISVASGHAEIYQLFGPMGDLRQCRQKAINTKCRQPQNLSDEFCTSCCPYGFFQGLTLGAEVQVCVPTHPLGLLWESTNHPILTLTKPSAQTDSFRNSPVLWFEKFDLVATFHADTTSLRIKNCAPAIALWAEEPIPNPSKVAWRRCDPHPTGNNPLSIRQISSKTPHINLRLPLTNH
jgi:hypothetical protein